MSNFQFRSEGKAKRTAKRRRRTGADYAIREKNNCITKRINGMWYSGWLKSRFLRRFLRESGAASSTFTDRFPFKCAWKRFSLSHEKRLLRCPLKAIPLLQPVTAQVWQMISSFEAWLGKDATAGWSQLPCNIRSRIFSVDLPAKKPLTSSMFAVTFTASPSAKPALCVFIFTWNVRPRSTIWFT